MSFGTTSFCALCTSQPSTALCEGCQRKFCYTCLSKHRNDLSIELDGLFDRRNEIVEIMNNRIPKNSTDRCSCFDEINRWENEMHANINRIASTARENVRQLLSESSKNVRLELDKVSQDLQQRQKTGGYVEGDLDRIKQQLIKLNDIVQKFNEQIRIDTSISKTVAWDSLLFVIPNKETYHVTPPSPCLQNRTPQRPSMPTSIPYSKQYQNIPSTPKSMPYSADVQRQSGRSGSMGSRPITYTCICCKTQNVLNENGRSFCSVCHSPAPF